MEIVIKKDFDKLRDLPKDILKLWTGGSRTDPILIDYVLRNWKCGLTVRHVPDSVDDWEIIVDNGAEKIIYDLGGELVITE